MTLNCSTVRCELYHHRCSRWKFYFCPSNYQPWSQFWSPLSLGRIAWPRQGSTAPPWTSKWSMSWHRSQTWLLGLRISRVRKYWIFAVFRQNTRCKRQAQFLQLLQNLQSSLRWSQTWGWKLFDLEYQLFERYYFNMIKRQCLYYYFNWYETITSSLIQIATGILGHCVEVRFDEQRCLGTTHYSGRTISTFSHISSFASSQTCNFAWLMVD